LAHTSHAQLLQIRLATFTQLDCLLGRCELTVLLAHL
jgi:hypothetical protein